MKNFLLNVLIENTQYKIDRQQGFKQDTVWIHKETGTIHLRNPFIVIPENNQILYNHAEMVTIQRDYIYNNKPMLIENFLKLAPFTYLNAIKCFRKAIDNKSGNWIEGDILIVEINNIETKILTCTNKKTKQIVEINYSSINNEGSIFVNMFEEKYLQV